MSFDSFLERVDARPFLPFEVALLNGRRIKIDQLESIRFFPNRKGSKLVFVCPPETDDSTFFAPESISAVRLQPPTGLEGWGSPLAENR